MFSCSLFKLIVFYFPVFDFINFIFEIKILQMVLIGSKVLMIFSHVLKNYILFRQIFFLRINIIFAIGFNFFLEFVTFKNVIIKFQLLSVWQTYQFFINLFQHVLFGHQLIKFRNVLLWVLFLLFFYFIHLFLTQLLSDHLKLSLFQQARFLIILVHFLF